MPDQVPLGTALRRVCRNRMVVPVEGHKDSIRAPEAIESHDRGIWTLATNPDKPFLMKENEKPTIEGTIELLKLLRNGELDRGGHPYWLHPVSVMEMLPADASPDEMLAALLHDEIEDGKTTEDRLRELGHSERTMQLLKALDRHNAPPGTTYMDWIRTIADSGDLGLIRIKHRDVLQNSNPERIAAMNDPEERAKVQEMAEGRYARARAILERALSKLGDEPSLSAFRR